MRSFIVLCFVAAASAQSGYNYQLGEHGSSDLSLPIQQGGSSGPSNQPGGSLNQKGGSPFQQGGSLIPSGSSPIQSGGSPLQSGGSPFQNGGSPFQSSGSPFQSGGSPNQSGGSSNSEPDQPATGEIEKEFYTYSAPEGAFEDPNAARQAIGSVKQGLRVVFIKGPENKGLEDAALALAKHAANQQTAIYVLNKQTDIGDLANKLNAINANNNHKPEVHFVKYRTPEDALNAQKAIQQQYDELDGPSKNIDGGVAPVLNFASNKGSNDGAPGSAPPSTYLPVSLILRHRN